MQQTPAWRMTARFSAAGQTLFRDDRGPVPGNSPRQDRP